MERPEGHRIDRGKTASHRRSRALLWVVALAAALAVEVTLNGPALAALRSLLPVLLAALVVLAFFGIGSLPARALDRNSDAGDRRLLAVALGAGISALFVFLPALAGFIEPALYALWLLAGLVLAAVELLHHPPRFQLQRPDVVGVTAIVLILLALAAVVPMLTTPPVSTDALEYHLLVPKCYLTDGSIHVLPGFVESNYPDLAETLYMMVLPLAGPVACKGLHFWFAILLLAALTRLSGRIVSGGTRWLAPAIYQTMPVAALVAAWAWNDAIFVLFTVLGLTALVDYHTATDRRTADAVRAGLLFGLAGWTKYTIVLVGLSLVPVVLAGLWLWRWRAAHVAAASAAAGAVSLTWTLKNLAFTGNPVFPFLHGIFHSPLWCDACNRYFLDTLTRYEFPHWSGLARLALPLRIALAPRIADTLVGALPLLLVPLLFLRSRRPAEVPLKLFAATSVLLWALLTQTPTRSLLPALAVVAVLGSAALDRATGSHSGLRPGLAVSLGFAGAINLIMIAAIAFGLLAPVRCFLGMESSRDYIRREARSQRSYEWLDAHSGVQTVLLVGLHNPFYLRRPALFSSYADRPVAESTCAGARSPEEIAQRLRTLHVTHVVVDAARWREQHRDGLYSWSEADRARFERFLQNECHPVAHFGPETIFRIDPAPCLLPSLPSSPSPPPPSSPA